jgi:hypothetical protein
VIAEGEKEVSMREVSRGSSKYAEIVWLKYGDIGEAFTAYEK